MPIWAIRDNFIEEEVGWSLRGWVTSLQIEMQVKLFQEAQTILTQVVQIKAHLETGTYIEKNLYREIRTYFLFGERKRTYIEKYIWKG